MRRIITLVTLVLAITALAAGAVQAHPHDPDGAVENGWFYSQAGPGDGTGFFGDRCRRDSILDRVFKPLAAFARLGYPVSRRWMEGPLTYQAFQKTVFQWQPRSGLFRVNIYDRLRDIGLDDELLTQRNIPKPWEFPQDDDQSFSFVQKNHLVLLELNDAIKTAWFSNPNWLNDYGLPVAYHDFGRLRVLQGTAHRLPAVDVPNGVCPARSGGAHKRGATTLRTPGSSRRPLRCRTRATTS